VNNNEEAAEAHRLHAKLDAGEKLTYREWTFMAYSPLGLADRCRSCDMPGGKPQDVTELYRPRVVMN
jgi:hypothetical protein